MAEAVAWAETGQLERALRILAQVQLLAENYQPWWVAQAFVLERLQRNSQARMSYVKAVGLSQHQAVRSYLQGRAQGLA